MLTDHPRSRGVYPAWGRTEDGNRGSSPLARGLRYTRRRWGQARGIIPARAGFTPSGPGGSGSRRDHPRSRGVYRSVQVVIAPGVGSSPLARGLHGEHGPGVEGGRIIPARAGFTLADPWNPNDEPCYQTAFTFSADLEPAPPSSGSAVVLRRSTMTPSEA